MHACMHAVARRVAWSRTSRIGTFLCSSARKSRATPAGVQVLTMKLDLKYWPTWELALDPGTCSWHRRQISPFPHNS